MQLDQFAGDVQAQSRTAPRRVRFAVEPVEALEDQDAVVGWDARTAVGYLDPGDVAIAHAHAHAAAIAHSRHLDPHLSLRRRELEGVGQQVEEHLLEPRRIDLRRHGGRRHHAQLDRTIDGQRLEVVRRQPHEMRQVDRAVVELKLGRLERGRIEQIVHVAEQSPGIAQDQLEITPVRVLGRQLGQHTLGRGQDKGERRAQLVADIGDEVRLDAIHLLGTCEEVGQLRVAFLESSSGVGHLPGPADDLGLHLVDVPRLHCGGPAQLDVLGDVLHPVDDVQQGAVGSEDGGVQRAPEALLETTTLVGRPLQVVLLDRHGVGCAIAHDPGQRGPRGCARLRSPGRQDCREGRRRCSDRSPSPRSVMVAAR